MASGSFCLSRLHWTVFIAVFVLIDNSKFEYKEFFMHVLRWDEFSNNLLEWFGVPNAKRQSLGTLVQVLANISRVL